MIKRRILILACACAIIAGATACSSGESEAKTDANGNMTATGSAICLVEDQDISYEVKLRVTTDPEGVIISVEDAGTEVPDGKDGPYITAWELFKTLEGKNADSISDTDIISGATYSSEAILEAVQDALK